MASKPVVNEIASLLTEAREQLTYFHELGVEHIESCSLPPRSSATPVMERLPEALFRRAMVSPASGVNQFPAGAPPVDTFQDKPPTGAAASEPSVLFADLGPPVKPLSRSSETFESIWADIGNCTRCPLYEARTHIVHTDGNHRARLMFVGEAPGADEDAQARPFVGRAGQLLTKIIEAIGFRRDEVLIGNVNRCRPPANRPPTPEEAASCKPFLLREIAAVRPEVIVVLGNTAMRNLLDTKIGITKLRGHFQEYEGAKVMPTFHPAYLLRDPSKKKETWADLKKVRDYLESTRKRGD